MSTSWKGIGSLGIIFILGSIISLGIVYLIWPIFWVLTGFSVKFKWFNRARTLAALISPILLILLLVMPLDSFLIESYRHFERDVMNGNLYYIGIGSVYLITSVALYHIEHLGWHTFMLDYSNSKP